MAKLARFILVGAVAAVIAGTAYERIGRLQDRKQLPQLGRSVDIGGRSLNINCAGAVGPPVILDAGANTPGYAWFLVQSKIAQFVKVCWYDRAGNGWSDSGPFPRTSEAIAKDLHVLLNAARIRPPYVLVGHSFGGTNIRVYSGLFPTEVAGMVLVDAAHEDEVRRLPRRTGGGPPASLRPMIDALTPAFLNIGLVRLIQPLSRRSAIPPKGLSVEQWRMIQQLRVQPKALAAESSSAMTAPQSWAQLKKAGTLGNRPLIVLTAGKSEWNPADPILARQAAEDQYVWIHELQTQFVQLSTRGRQTIVAESTHGIPYEAPEAVAEAVREVVSTVRRESPGGK